MKVVYIVGPFWADNAWAREQNIRRAEALALEVAQAGFAVICVHAASRFYPGVLPESFWLAADLEIIRRCDAVLLVAGWEYSTGSRTEVDDCRERGQPIFHSIKDLKEKWGG